MMMKWLIRLSFPALGLLLLLIFFGLGDPGKVSEPAAEEKPEAIPSFEGLLPAPIPTEGPEIVFKWQDTEGNWHYADQPPAGAPGMRWPSSGQARTCATSAGPTMTTTGVRLIGHPSPLPHPRG